MREAEQIVSIQGAAERPPCSCQTMLGRKMWAHGSICIPALPYAEWHAGQRSACMPYCCCCTPCTDHPDSGIVQESTSVD